MIPTGQGAAACSSQRIEERSYRCRTSSGSASSRLNWVGTMWVLVTRYFSTRASACSESQESMYTTQCPIWTAPHPNTVTAVW